MNFSVLLALAKLLVVDVIFLLILALIVGLLASTKRAAFAVMRRNFVGYFSNPTGYVFLCIFVFLTSLAAFWPYEFFNQNLAVLDQLNYWFPLIMLVFIPAITMSIWAEEKRQGTDELLLTLPADDFDIVIGKYMSAAAIFTASLLFSQLSTFITLAILTRGDVDTGLIFTTYLGYWFVGLTMIAIGMVASFLTGNLTVGFILGALFNAPLAFASLADAIIPQQIAARVLEAAGLSRSFDDFGRGVVSLSSVAYFLLVAGVALYVCMVLIGRRHWTGGKDGSSMAWHYIGRALALVVITGGAVILFRNWEIVRYDATEGQVSSLAPATKRLIRDLDPERPIIIDAFISDDIPEQYATTRYELVNLLKEFESEANKRGRSIDVNLHDDIELFSEEATLAEERFGIRPVERLVREKGTFQQKRLILGAALRSGLEKVTVPIFEYGIPVEYELVRSIDTVAQGTRKRIGIVETDAQLMGGITFAGMQPQQTEKHPIVTELEKQYEVEAVDLTAPLSPGQYAALVVVQPSTLPPDRFDRLVDAVNAGIPTAIFEDPFPFVQQNLTPTGDPKQAPGGMFGGGGMQPKGEIRKLWEALDLRIPGEPGQQGLYSPELVWQQFNPYPNLALGPNDLWAFIDEQATGAVDALSEENPITSGLRQVLLLYGGAVQAAEGSELQHTPLLTTGTASGRIDYSDLRQNLNDPMGLMRAQGPETGPSTMAMAIEGKAAPTKAEQAAEGEDAAVAATKKAVYVADTDLMLPVFLQLRADPNQAQEIRFQFQNVTFLLNTVDWLTGEIDFLEVRKHEPIFSSLTLVEEVREAANSSEREAVTRFQNEFDDAIRELDEQSDRELAKLREKIEELQSQSADGQIDRAELQRRLQEFEIKQGALERVKQVQREKFEREMNSRTQAIRREADMDVVRIQNLVKALAVTVPCIPPLLVGIVVFASRRLRERDNITKARLK
ncbi:Gldg family protein [Candidatus Laterigemmans baculatus]|uniref:Gldg family protein n=1 Tax=Candidatus Laterigemmans baculatus TaxID=2770505 RepID=UPI0013D8EBF9|nr:Gldg family protein [Candidatus Laterigemmans baculatus]